MTEALLIAMAAALVFYAALLLALVLAGRRADAAALARMIPDCVDRIRRLLADPSVPRRRKLLLLLLLGYLAMPLDLVPDFLPVVGHLDDVLLVALALSWLARGAGGSPKTD